MLVFFKQFFWYYIKMSEINALTSYQKNRDLILNKKEDYYKKNTQPANIGPQDVHVPLQRPQDIL